MQQGKNKESYIPCNSLIILCRGDLTSDIIQRFNNVKDEVKELRDKAYLLVIKEQNPCFSNALVGMKF